MQKIFSYIIAFILSSACCNAELKHLNPYFSPCKLIDFPVNGKASELMNDPVRVHRFWQHFAFPVEILKNEFQPTEFSQDGMQVKGWSTVTLRDREDGLTVKIHYFNILPRQTAEIVLRQERQVFAEFFNPFGEVIRERYKRQWEERDIDKLLDITHDSRDRTIFAEVYNGDVNLGTHAVTLSPFQQITISDIGPENVILSQKSHLSSSGLLMRAYLPHRDSTLKEKLPDVGGEILTIPLFRSDADPVLLSPMEIINAGSGFKIDRQASEIATVQNISSPTPQLITFGEEMIIEPRFFTKNKAALQDRPEAHVKLDLFFLSFVLDPLFTTKFNRLGRLSATYTSKPRLYERYGFKTTGQVINVLGKPHFGLRATTDDLLKAMLFFENMRASKDRESIRKILEDLEDED